MNFCHSSLELTMRIIIYDINKTQMLQELCLVLFGSFFTTFAAHKGSDLDMEENGCQPVEVTSPVGSPETSLLVSTK